MIYKIHSCKNLGEMSGVLLVITMHMQSKLRRAANRTWVDALTHLLTLKLKAW